MQSETQVVDHVPCPFCGCLCDDIRLEIVENRIVQNHNGCAISKSKFMSHQSDRLLYPMIQINGMETQVTIEGALDAAANTLANAQRPLVYGLSSTENDAHREAYRIAELLGGDR